MSSAVSPALLISTFGLVFLAELPDKTALTILVLAASRHPAAVFLGAAAAFAIQSAVAVAFGGLLSALPALLIRLASGILFLIFAAVLWRQKDERTETRAEKMRANFARTAWASFAAIFAAEWGDLTQLATAALEAKHRAPLTIFIGATAALWTSAALAAALGHHAKRYLHPERLRRAAACAFVLVGAFLLLKA